MKIMKKEGAGAGISPLSSKYMDEKEKRRRSEIGCAVIATLAFLLIFALVVDWYIG